MNDELMAMSPIRADIVAVTDDESPTKIRRRIAKTFVELDDVLNRHVRLLKENTGHVFTIKEQEYRTIRSPLDARYWEIRSDTTDDWFYVVAQVGVQ